MKAPYLGKGWRDGGLTEEEEGGERSVEGTKGSSIFLNWKNWRGERRRNKGEGGKKMRKI